VIYGSKLALERFLPRNRGHIVQIASAAGKAGYAGGATYCATKHAVVGLSEAIHAELAGTGVDVSVVMPVVVNTELGSGLASAKGFKAQEPEDVAAAIVEALQTGRFEVFVPRSMAAVTRIGAIVPRRAMEAFARAIGGDKVLWNPDHHARAAYEARMERSVAGAATASAGSRTTATAAGAPAAKASSSTATAAAAESVAAATEPIDESEKQPA
jgi:short chain dehydrogenase